jgi:hypothetical protein
MLNFSNFDVTIVLVDTEEKLRDYSCAFPDAL